MNVNLTFLGGSGTVTGSKYLVRYNGKSLLVDCGLFQGYKQLRLRNWQPLPVTPHQIDAVVLTHAHQDHSGYRPCWRATAIPTPSIARRARATCAPSCCPTADTCRKRTPPSSTGTSSAATARHCRCTRGSMPCTA